MIGYSFYAEGMGEEVLSVQDQKIPGPITILVGIRSDKETINNIFVIENNETLLYWQLLVKKNYFDKFVGLKIEDTYFKHDGGEVDVITGATLSSTSVLNLVREAALGKVKLI